MEGEQIAWSLPSCYGLAGKPEGNAFTKIIF